MIYIVQSPTKSSIDEPTRKAVSLVKSLELNNDDPGFKGFNHMQILLNRFGDRAAPNIVPFDNSTIRTVKINAKMLGST